MKMKFPVVALSAFLLANITHAQNKLVLNIPERNAGISLIYKTNLPLPPENGTLEVDAATWQFQITTKRKDLKVIIANTDGGQSDTITDFLKLYTISNDTLLQHKFILSKNLSIKAEGPGLNPPKLFTFKYINARTPIRANTVADLNNNNPSSFFDYNVGYPVYDAFFLAKPGNNIQKFKVLQYYVNGESDHQKFKEAFKDNKLLDSLVKVVLNEIGLEAGGPLSSLVSSAGSLDVTKLADGFAKFLVERTKEELNIAFFEKFQDIINKPEYEDVHTLFPQTYSTLEVIGDKLYNYGAYLNTLREAFEKDLQSLLSNLPTVINDGRYKDFFDNHKDLKAICLSALYIGQSLQNKEHPGDIIDGYDVHQLDDVNLNVKGGIQSLQLFSKSLRSQNSGHYWITRDTLKMLVANPVAFKIYLGLLWQQANDIVFEKDSLRQVLNFYSSVETKFREVADYLNGFIKETELLKNDIENVTGTDKDNLTFTDYYNYYNHALDLIEYAKNITQLPLLKNSIVIAPRFKNYISIARAGGDLALDITRKNYSSAIINTYRLYNFAFGGDTRTLEKIAKDSASPATEIEAAKKLIADRITIIKNESTEKVKKFLLQYGPFIASVSQAQNSDDVKNAIEAVALPSGSSRVKRETDWNIALNAYVGIYYGREKIKGVDSGSKWNSYGITAPIGISISRGSILKGKDRLHGGKSLTAFISLLDLGAVTSFRFTNDSAEKVPTIELKDIFSPGILLSYGFGKVPMSLNFGYQYGPLLRKVNLNENSYKKNYTRFSVSLCVDIPFLNFYTKSVY